MPQQDACALLDEDHMKVDQLFQQYRSAEPSRKNQLAQTICHELTVHTQIEDEIFYPAVRKATGDDPLVDEAKHEHEEARQMIQEIERGQPSEQLMMALQKAIEHHVGEERSEMFPKARQASGLDLVKLAQQLERRKAELMAAHPA